MKKKIIVFAIVVVLFLGCGAIFGIVSKNNSNKTTDTWTLKDNVYSLDSDSDEISAIVSLSDDKIVSKTDLGYEKDDIIAIGLGENTGNGGIFKIKSVNTTQNTTEYSVESAAFTDVYEEAHIEKSFYVTDKDVNEIVQDDVAVNNENSFWGPEEVAAWILEDDIGDSYTAKIEKQLGDGVSISGSAGFKWILDVKIEISLTGKNSLYMALTETESGEIVFKCENGYAESTSMELMNVNLPSIEFWAGIPIVIDNDVSVVLDASAELNANFTSKVGIERTSTTGFKWEGNKTKEIKESEYKSDGITYETNASVEGNVAVGISVHYTAKLYGLIGPDFSAGLEASASAELVINNSQDDKEIEYIGAVDMAITPVLKGNIVVNDDLFDIEPIELFKMDLEPLWSEHWESSGTWKEDIEKQKEEKQEENNIAVDNTVKKLCDGDFSEFIGEYKPIDGTAKSLGRKEGDIPNISMHSDGSLSWVSDWNYRDLIVNDKPKSIHKNNDGSYTCVIQEGRGVSGESDDYNPEIDNYIAYIIYPIGVIDDSAKLQGKDWLSDVVYIRYQNIGGGALDIIFYMIPKNEKGEPIITNYEGVDWVSVNSYSETVGETFISGTGIKYTVVSVEENENSGRISLTLRSENGDIRRMGNIPAFQFDPASGITYYDIYE